MRACASSTSSLSTAISASGSRGGGSLVCRLMSGGVRAIFTRRAMSESSAQVNGAGTVSRSRSSGWMISPALFASRSASTTACCTAMACSNVNRTPSGVGEIGLACTRTASRVMVMFMGSCQVAG
jgi:hypothetical protein